MIGILCAMAKELEMFLLRMDAVEHHDIGNFDFVTGVLCGRKVVVCCCGVGKVNAAACTQTLLMNWKPRLVINSGVAGALRQNLEVGDICIATELVQYDVDTTAVGDPAGMVSTVEQIWFRCAEQAVMDLMRAARSLDDLRVYSGRVGTGDRFLEKAEDKAAVVRRFDPLCCDMEGAAIGQICFMQGVDFAVVRAISDADVTSGGDEYMRCMPGAAEQSARVVLKYLELTA